MKMDCFRLDRFRSVRAVAACVCSLAMLAFAQDPVATDSAVVAQQNSVGVASADSSKIVELMDEIAVRDSVMAIHDSACTAEKDSLRLAMQMESSMCDSWKQSYDVMKENYGTCNQALNAANDTILQKTDDAADAKQSNIKANIASFVSGLGIGLLLLIIL